MYHAEPEDDLLEDIALSLTRETLEADESVIINFEFASRRYLSQPALFLHRILERFMPRQLVLSGRPELVNVYTGEKSIDGVATRVVAAKTERGIEAYRILTFEDDNTLPFTVQYSTSEIQHGRDMVKRFRSVNPVSSSLIAVSYGVFSREKQLTLRSLTAHFDQLVPGCLEVPNSKEIIDALSQKGWRLYLLHEKQGVSYILADSGPASSLHVGSSYAVVPAADNPHDEDWIDATRDHAELTRQYLSDPHGHHPPRAIVKISGGVNGICLVDEQDNHRPIDDLATFSRCVREHFPSYDPTKQPDIRLVH